MFRSGEKGGREVYLAHIAVKIVKVTQLLCSIPRIRIRRIKPLMMLHIHKNTMLPRSFHQLQMIFQQLRSGLRDEYVMPSFNSIHRNIKMRTVRREDRNCATLRKIIDGGLVGVRVCRVVCGIRFEGDVEAVIDVADVLLEVFPDGDELLS